MSAGIYRWIVARKGKPKKFYIGQAIDLQLRRKGHLIALRKGKHKNQQFQRAFVKYGEAAFSFEIIVICAPEKNLLLIYEQAILNFYISAFSQKAVYNICLACVASLLGVKHDPEVYRSRADAQRGKKKPAEEIERMRVAKRASLWRPTPEHIEKVAASRRGVNNTKEHNNKIAATLFGTIRPPDVIKRMVQTRYANGSYVNTAEQREKISASLKGRKKSLEHVQAYTFSRRMNTAIRHVGYAF